MLASRLLQSLNLVTSVMSRIPLVLVVAFAAGAHATPCANDADFVSDGTFGDGVLTCADTALFWRSERGAAASDAAACDAVSSSTGVTVKSTVWYAAAACCGGADVSVCGAAPNLCANPATFNRAATATIGDDSTPCNTVNNLWIAQRGSTASDAAACDTPFKANVWAAAAACCGGADDSVCGAPPTTCDSLAACDGENPGTVGVSAACFEALGGIIGASGNDAAWSTCTDASGPTDVPTACQDKACSDLAACPGSKACASSDDDDSGSGPINEDCPAGCVSVNARQRRQLLFGSLPIQAKCPEGCVAA